MSTAVLRNSKLSTVHKITYFDHSFFCANAYDKHRKCFMTLDRDCFQARLWMQVMRQLRHGVKLKKMEQLESEQPREFELTPYEMLMEDIASRRFNLSKVTVSHRVS